MLPQPQSQPPGPEFNTFTAIARCARTNRLGIATATRSLAVGSRVPFVQPRLGAVAIMAIADTRLGLMAQRLLQTGYKAQGVIDQLVLGDPYHEYRQLGVIDDDGFAAARTGANNRDWAGHHVHENFIALGNVLHGEHILTAIEDGYNADPDDEIEDRLMTAIEAGRDAGGQHGGQRSAAILVYEDKEYARVDLRVDAHEEPVGELRRVFDFYKPAIEYYVHRQVDARVKPLSEVVDVEGY
ncbi:MAG: DUF1028 domain-containing protein [Alphaproteobacteria bacterium]|jgi:uncharacterized Ntn-hydrolase superfamily protein|nr:DUF1028 domain-containing protein [Alphaproteobacteria bacterium]